MKQVVALPIRTGAGLPAAGLLLFALALAFFTPGAASAQAAGETMRSFEASYLVNADGTVDVIETITWDFADVPDRHGIFRDLLESQPCAIPSDRTVECPPQYTRRWEYEVLAVTDGQGAPQPYEIGAGSGALIGETIAIRIGDPNVTVTGAQTYVISYRIAGAIDHDPTTGLSELYWNVTGEWPVPIEHVGISVAQPAHTTGEAICLQGYFGAGEPCTATWNPRGGVIFVSTRPLAPSEQMTIAFRFDGGIAPTRPLLNSLPGAQVGEVMHSFDAQYVIREDGVVEVTETIVWNFADEPDKHGIFRDLIDRQACPDEHPEGRVYDCPPEDDRRWRYEDIRVSQDNQPVPVETMHEGDALRLRIGDPDEEVEGEHTYVITYELHGALDAYEEHDEFYWNATGVWPVTVEQFTARVTLPDGAEVVADCYEGPAGSNATCPAQATGNTAVYSSSQPIRFNEQVTIVAAFPKGVVDVPPPITEDRVSIDDFFALDIFELGGAALGSLVAIFGAFGLWWRHGRDRAYKSLYYLTNDPTEHTRPMFSKRDVVIEYLPPDGLKPAQMGVILDESADTLDVTATIVDLAVRGHLHIKEIPKEGWFGSKDWQLTKLHADDALLPFEEKLYNGLFATGETVELSDLKNTFMDRLAKTKKALYDDAMKRNWFNRRPETARGMWIGIAVVVEVLGIGACVLAGWLLGRALLGVPLVLAGLLLFILAFSMARRTAAGSEALRRVLGFRLYVVTAETRQHEFNEQQNIFAKYLPYAIVFGAVEKWAKAFSGLDDEVVQSSTAGLYAGAGAFSAVAFSDSLHGFSNSVSSTISSSPSSSGSGSGGGGSSGGGGGGGGGGSW